MKTIDGLRQLLLARGAEAAFATAGGFGVGAVHFGAGFVAADVGQQVGQGGFEHYFPSNHRDVDRISTGTPFISIGSSFASDRISALATGKF